MRILIIALFLVSCDPDFLEDNCGILALDKTELKVPVQSRGINVKFTIKSDITSYEFMPLHTTVSGTKIRVTDGINVIVYIDTTACIMIDWTEYNPGCYEVHVYDPIIGATLSRNKFENI